MSSSGQRFRSYVQNWDGCNAVLSTSVEVSIEMSLSIDINFRLKFLIS